MWSQSIFFLVLRLFQQMNKGAFKFPKFYATIEQSHNHFIPRKKKPKQVFPIVPGSHKNINKATTEHLILIKDISWFSSKINCLEKYTPR